MKQSTEFIINQRSMDHIKTNKISIKNEPDPLAWPQKNYRKKCLLINLVFEKKSNNFQELLSKNNKVWFQLQFYLAYQLNVSGVQTVLF